MEPEPEPFCVRGTVKDGKVVLNVALPLPDGATVYVATEPPDQISRIGLPGPMPEHEIKKLMLALARRPDLADDPDWQQKLRGDRERLAS